MNTKYGFKLQHPANSTIETRNVEGVYPYQYIRIQNFTENEVMENKGKLGAGKYYLEISIYDHKVGHKSSTICKEETELEEVNLGGTVVYRGAVDQEGDLSRVRDGVCVNQPDLDLYIVASEDEEVVTKTIIDNFEFIQ